MLKALTWDNSSTTVNEDSTITLPTISASVTDSSRDIKCKNIQSLTNVTLTDASNNSITITNGEAIISPAQYAGLKVTPTANWSGV